MNCSEKRNGCLALMRGWCPVFLAPALSEGALGATVRRSRPTSCRQPEHRSDNEERSGRQLCQVHKCEKLFIGKVAARSRATSPTKRGRPYEASRVLVDRPRVQVRCTPVVPFADVFEFFSSLKNEFP